MNFADRMRWLLLWETLLVTGTLGTGLILLVPAWRDEITFFLLAIPSSAFLLIPHEPILLYYARTIDMWTIGVLSGAGAAIAAAIDYQAFHQLWQLRHAQPVKRTRLYRWAVRWFTQHPFLTTWIFFLLPLPDHPIRILAPAAGFPRRRYMAAVGLGRFPRGVALAWLGREIPFPLWSLILIGVLIILVGLWTTFHGRNESPAHAAESRPPDESSRSLRP